MNENKKNITSGDILEMMVQAGLKPASALEEESEAPRSGNPIISINGKDVQWRELERRRSKRSKAA
jgi:hypothetical protein